MSEKYNVKGINTSTWVCHVRIVCPKESYDKFIDYADKHKLIYSNSPDESIMDCCAVNAASNNLCCFGWNCILWDYENPVANVVIHALDDLSNNNFDYELSVFDYGMSYERNVFDHDFTKEIKENKQADFELEEI